jgi:hypothetical protein
LIGVKAFSIAAAGILMLLAAVKPTQAFTLYTDRAAWEAAVGHFITETFDTNIANDPVITFGNGTRSTGINPFSTGITIFMTNRVQNGSYWGRVDSSKDFPKKDEKRFEEIRWLFPTPVFAFGADWLQAANGSGLTLSGNFDSLGVETISFFEELGFPGDGFLGIVGTAPFSELVFREENPVVSGVGDEFFYADNLSIAAVPEPTTIAGLVAAGAGMIAMRRRQNRDLSELLC